MSPPMHLTSLQANQGSNTWPSSFQNPPGNAEGVYYMVIWELPILIILLLFYSITSIQHLTIPCI